MSAIQLTPTHDGEAACAVELTFPGGGRSMVQLDSAGLARVMAQADVHNLSDLLGLAWTVLLAARDPAQE